MRALDRSIVAVTALVAVLTFGSVAGAATVAAWWGGTVQVGSVAQGNATFYLYTTGTGALGLRLNGLKPSTIYWVGLYAGSCSSLGSRILSLPSVTSTTTGTVARGLTISTLLTSRVRASIRAGQISAAVGSVRRCATLARILAAPSPTPAPPPTPAPTPMPTLMVTPTPYVYPTPYY
jgi:hypothetical protein